MELLSLIYALFIGPLELFFEVLYAAAYRFIGNPGLAIVFLSLAMNFLVLPLYRRADAMQEEERERAKRMKPWTDHIKKTFKGDERFMMLQAYNRQCGYKPTDALKGSVSLLLEIPFFIAAYHFLSNLWLLQGVSFGPIVNLGAPDALLSFDGFSVNLLPILMTAINLASAIVYMKGLPLSNKVQMYGIAAIFLVLLYNSPAGLVFYWTLNNVFSLVKNIFYRMKDPGKALCIVASFAGLALLIYVLCIHPASSLRKQAIVVVACLALQLPLVWVALKKRRARWLHIPEAGKADTRRFLLSSFFLAIFTGALIPLSVIQASPTEFINISDYSSPLWYVAHSLMVALGTFVVWFGVFYWLASPRGKTVFNCAMFALLGVSIVDYLLFVPELGNLSPDLQYGDVLVLSLSSAGINSLAVIAIALVLMLLWIGKKKWVTVICTCLCAAVAVVSVMGAVDVNSSAESLLGSVERASTEKPHVTLSKNGKNVVVIMMDRAAGSLLPYLINEKPELQEGLRGFTYYPNTMSYGVFTNMGAPGLYGGYDYVPEAMNARDDVSLADKHNEALKVVPTVLSQAGFETTFFDPTYAGYSYTPILSALDDVPNLHAYITMNGTWDTREGFRSDSMSGNEEKRKRNFFCYSLFRIAPLVLRPALYHSGDYNALGKSGDDASTPQLSFGASRSEGLSPDFLESYSVLQHLAEMTSVEDGAPNALFIMSNDTAHSPTILQEPEYIPAERVDNSAYDDEHRQRFAADGSYITLDEESGDATYSPTMHYEVNMAALRELCQWFDYLRENDVWDNTRIIIVSDHGIELDGLDDMVKDVEDGEDSFKFDMRFANCLLLVKDFGNGEFTVDETLMTNADTPALAVSGLVEQPVNPFTGNPITLERQADGEHVLFSYDYSIETNNGNVFLPGYWFSVHDDMRNPGNWDYMGYY